MCQFLSPTLNINYYVMEKCIYDVKRDWLRDVAREIHMPENRHQSPKLSRYFLLLNAKQYLSDTQPISGLCLCQEDKAELKAQNYLLEKEKSALELQLSGKQSHEQAYIVQIEHLKCELKEITQRLSKGTKKVRNNRYSALLSVKGLKHKSVLSCNAMSQSGLPILSVSQGFVRNSTLSVTFRRNILN